MSAADPTKRPVLVCTMKIRHPDETSKLMRPEASWRKMPFRTRRSRGLRVDGMAQCQVCEGAE